MKNGDEMIHHHCITCFSICCSTNVLRGQFEPPTETPVRDTAAILGLHFQQVLLFSLTRFPARKRDQTSYNKARIIDYLDIFMHCLSIMDSPRAAVGQSKCFTAVIHGGQKVSLP